MSALYVLACVLSASPNSAISPVPTAPVSHYVSDGYAPQATDANASEIGSAAKRLSEDLTASTEAKSRTVAQWKRHVSETLARTAKAQGSELAAAAEEVLRDYRQLPNATHLSAQDRDELKQKLRIRLLAQQQK